MRLTPQEEYGLRCALVVSREAPDASHPPVSIERIAESEGLGYEHTAKIMRLLRRGGVVTSTRGAHGGYHLARPATAITLWDALVSLDRPLVGNDFCSAFTGRQDTCTHASTACQLRGVWGWVGHTLQEGLSQVTLDDLLAGRTPATRS